eukprot:scaffold327243_cov93-Tisochrysis_lutea.AAC.1
MRGVADCTRHLEICCSGEDNMPTHHVVLHERKKPPARGRDERDAVGVLVDAELGEGMPSWVPRELLVRGGRRRCVAPCTRACVIVPLYPKELIPSTGGDDRVVDGEHCVGTAVALDSQLCVAEPGRVPKDQDRFGEAEQTRNGLGVANVGFGRPDEKWRRVSTFESEDKGACLGRVAECRSCAMRFHAMDLLGRFRSLMQRGQQQRPLRRAVWSCQACTSAILTHGTAGDRGCGYGLGRSLLGESQRCNGLRAHVAVGARIERLAPSIHG